MDSPDKELKSSNIKKFNKNSESMKEMKNYTSFQLSDVSKVQELLSGISLAGFYGEDSQHQQEPAKASNSAFTHISQLKIGQRLYGTVSSSNRLGWFVDIAVGQDAFLHKSNMKGHKLNLGSNVNVEITNLDLPKNKITLDLHSVLKNDKPAIDPALLNISSKMTCSVCNVEFVNREEQVQHYKLDWHRYNLKQKIMGDDSITEEMFDKLANDDEISSLSGTDSDKSDDESANDSTGYSSTSGSEAKGSPRRKLRSKLMINRLPRRERSDSVTSTDTECEDDRMSVNNRLPPKIYLCNCKGNVVALYRCLVHGKKNTPEHQQDLLTMVQNVPFRLKWAIILLGGGHFAAAIFDGSESIAHKTFHRYTCRAKQGGAQTSKDSAGRPPKSGGATLRRYNEAALVKVGLLFLS